MSYAGTVTQSVAEGPSNFSREALGKLKNGFISLALENSLTSVHNGRTTGGLEGHFHATRILRGQYQVLSLEDVVPVVVQHSPYLPVQVSFLSDRQHTEYTLTPRQAELIRRLLDNPEILDKNWLLTDLIQACIPEHISHGSESSSSPIQEEGSSSPSSSYYTANTSPPEPLAPAETQLVQAVDAIVISPPETAEAPPSLATVSSSSNESLLSPDQPAQPIPTWTNDQQEEDVFYDIPKAFSKNSAIVNWNNGLPLSANRPYLEGSYQDFISGLLHDHQGYIICIGIVKDQQRQVSKDLKYFDQVLPEAQKEFTKHCSRLTRKGSPDAFYDLHSLRLHWIHLNIIHLRRLQSILNEVFYRHTQAHRLLKSNNLNPDSLRSAVSTLR